MDNKRKNGQRTRSSGLNDYKNKTEYSREEVRRVSRAESIGSPQRRSSYAKNIKTGDSNGRSRYASSVSTSYERKSSSSGAYGARRINSAETGTKRGYTADASQSYRYERSRGEDRLSLRSDADRRRRLEASKKRKRQRALKIRAALIVIGCAVFTALLLFMTPIFDITQIRLEGNNTVSKSTIEEKIGYLIGKNLFSSSSSKIENQMLEISQISSVEVKKTFFPAAVTVSITESLPAAYMLSGNTIVIIDSGMRVIDDSNSYSTDGIPSLSGIAIPSYKLNEQLKTDSEEKDEILQTLLRTFEATGLLSKITYISLDDLSSIKFNYENRIETDCGSSLELERKIRMFAEAVNSSSLSDNAIGSIDLSVPGQAVYTP